MNTCLVMTRVREEVKIMENSENTKDIEAIANEISKSLYPELHTAKPVVPRGNR